MTPQEWLALPDFSSTAGCPACGDLSFSCKYITWDLVHPVSKKLIQVGWIQKKCGRCGFNWNEKPLHLANLGA